MKRPQDIQELRTYLIKLEQSIEDLMDNQDVCENHLDEVLTNYYMSYSDVARLKITDPDEIETLVILGNSLAYLYDSIKVDNYK